MSAPRCGGAREVQNLDDPSHHEFIGKALVGADGGHAGRAYTIVSATVQVVAGSKYTYLIKFNDDQSGEVYKITAWSRPWLSDEAEKLQVTFDKHTVDDE